MSFAVGDVPLDEPLLASRALSAVVGTGRPVDVDRGIARGAVAPGKLASVRWAGLPIREGEAAERGFSVEKMLASEAGRPDTGVIWAWKVVSVLVVLMVLVPADGPDCC